MGATTNEGVLLYVAFLVLVGFHGRLEDINICLLSLLFYHSMLDISPFSCPIIGEPDVKIMLK